MCQPLLVNKNHRNYLRPQNPLQSGIFRINPKRPHPENPLILKIRIQTIKEL